MIEFQIKHPAATGEMLGYVPLFFSEADPRSAKEQIDANYAHGGGWSPFKGFTMRPDGSCLDYPGDPPQRLIAEAKLHKETLRLYDCAWLAIVQEDGSYEIARID